MGLTVEEIKIKLGLDSQELDEGTRKALSKIAGFGNEAHKSFLHAESGGRAFHKVLHQLTEQSPLLGNAMRLALSPIGGMFAIITAAAVGLHQEIEKLNGVMDKFDKFTGGKIGNVMAAMRTAGRGNAADRRRGEKETDEFSDPLSDLIHSAKTTTEKRSALGMVDSARTSTARDVLGYNSGQSSRDKARLIIAKADEQLKSLEAQRAEVSGIASSTEGSAQTVKDAQQGGLWEKASAGVKYAISGGGLMTERNLHESAVASQKALEEQIKRETETRDKLTDSLADEKEKHDEDVSKLKKLDAARQTLTEAIEESAKHEKEKASKQALYNNAIGAAMRNQSEAQNAPYTPGLQEMAGYRGPYGEIARQSLAARDAAKQSLSLATPEDLAKLRTGYNEAGNTLRTDLAGATTAQGRNKAFQRYDQSLQGLLGGRVTPEHNLEVIAEHIKQLNEKASGEGLKIQGTE
jgi:hypothetical protein